MGLPYVQLDAGLSSHPSISPFNHPSIHPTQVSTSRFFSVHLSNTFSRPAYYLLFVSPGHRGVFVVVIALGLHPFLSVCLFDQCVCVCGGGGGGGCVCVCVCVYGVCVCVCVCV